MIDLVGTLGRLLTRHGNRVGAVLYSGQEGSGHGPGRRENGSASRRVERVIPARCGRNHVLWLINDLLAQPRLPRAGFTDLGAMLEGALSAIKRRSLVFVVSDFISAPGWERPLMLLRQRHDVLAVRLWDPTEVELPDVGPVWIEDAETGEQLYVDTHDPRFRARLAEMARDREQSLATTFRRSGVEPWSISTGEDLVRSIVRHASTRKQVHRGRGSSAAAPVASAQRPGAVTT
jgi:uncharacterized protein (DUF58 family)